MRYLWMGFVGLAAWQAGAQDLSFCGCDHEHEKVAPYISVHTDVRLHADQVYDADNSDDENFTMKTHTHVDLEISPFEDWFIRSSLKIEQEHSHDHGGDDDHDDHDDHDEGSGSGDQYFEDHVLLLEQLFLVYAPGSWEFFGGKFNPVSGLDQHAIPGFYGYEVEEETSILGRIGAGASYQFETEQFGVHRVRGSGFFRDTTVLNESLINGNDEPDDREDGGLANTEDFSSWAVSLSGDDLLYKAIGNTIHEFDYVLAYARQDAGYGADEHSADEERGVIGGVYTVTLTEDLQVRGVGEFKDIQNNGGHDNEDLRVSTGGLGVYFDGWELGGSYSLLDYSEEDDGHYMQASLGYTWQNGLGVSGGWKSVEEEGDTQKSIGLMLSYHGSF